MTKSLFAAVDAAYEAWASMDHPASLQTEGRILRGQLWLGRNLDHPQREKWRKLLEDLRAEHRGQCYQEAIEGTPEHEYRQAWDAARVAYEEAEKRYLAALEAQRQRGIDRQKSEEAGDEQSDQAR